jgi:hypothetical protein
MNASNETINNFTEKERLKASQQTVTVTTLDDLDKEVGFFYYHIIFD